MSINADKVKKKSNRKRLDRFFGRDKAQTIIDCLQDCVNQGKSSADMGDCVKNCLIQKGFSASKADEAVSLMGFITVG
ncbi:MAG: hypothetical protein ACFFA3_00250 [Promethearchaeota archaeon]